MREKQQRPRPLDARALPARSRAATRTRADDEYVGRHARRRRLRLLLLRLVRRRPFCLRDIQQI